MGLFSESSSGRDERQDFACLHGLRACSSAASHTIWKCSTVDEALVRGRTILTHSQDHLGRCLKSSKATNHACRKECDPAQQDQITSGGSQRFQSSWKRSQRSSFPCSASGGCLCLLYTRIDLPDTLRPRISERSGNSCCPRGLTKNVVVNPIDRTDLRQRLRAIDRQLQLVRVEAHLHSGHD